MTGKEEVICSDPCPKCKGELVVLGVTKYGVAIFQCIDCDIEFEISLAREREKS